MQTYIRPKASGKELLLVTRITVFVFGMFTGVLSIILFVVSSQENPAAHAFNECTLEGLHRVLTPLCPRDLQFSACFGQHHPWAVRVRSSSICC